MSRHIHCHIAIAKTKIFAILALRFYLHLSREMGTYKNILLNVIVPNKSSLSIASHSKLPQDYCIRATLH